MCLKSPCAVPVGDASRRPHNLIEILLPHFSPFKAVSPLSGTRFNAWAPRCREAAETPAVSTRVLRNEAIILLTSSHWILWLKVRCADEPVPGAEAARSPRAAAADPRVSLLGPDASVTANDVENVS